MITALACPLAVSSRVTVLLAWLLTYSALPSLLSAVPKAPGPAASVDAVASGLSVVVSRRVTVPRLLSET